MSEIESNGDKSVTRREESASWKAHYREHELHLDAHEAEHVMTAEALKKATETLEVRLESMNEFRAQLEKQATQFITKEYYDVKHETLTKEMDAEKDIRIRLEAQIGVWKSIAIFLGAPGIIALIWALLAAFSGKALSGPNGLF